MCKGEGCGKVDGEGRCVVREGGRLVKVGGV